MELNEIRTVVKNLSESELQSLLSDIKHYISSRREEQLREMARESAEEIQKVFKEFPDGISIAEMMIGSKFRKIYEMGRDDQGKGISF